MRLNTNQRAKVLEWVAAGKKTDEINRLAARLKEPFTVTRQQVDQYRKKAKVNIEQIQQAADQVAVAVGLRDRDERVRRLADLAERLEHDLKTKLWTLANIKGRGKDRLKIMEFNAAEIAQYRGLLDDIARELGDRKNNVKVEESVVLIWDEKDRAKSE